MPAVTRFDDADVAHCSVRQRAEGNTVNVWCNANSGGNLISCQGDNNTIHLLPGVPCPAHAAAITFGSSTVKINGDRVGRVGDAITGCTRVAEGSDNVYAGPAFTQREL